MPELFNSETGWLNVTNAVLGLAVLVCFLVVGRAMVQEMLVRVSKRGRVHLAKDDHAFNLRSLGITMADGGEPINEMARNLRKTSTDPDDSQNIIRSDN